MPQSATKILVVDDDPSFRQGLRASLQSSGYDVHNAANAEEALEYVREHPIDIVLLDINMPGIGGLEACRRIRAAAPQAAIVMLTVRDAEGDIILALETGADDYVTKPFRLGELIARLHAVLRRTMGEGAFQRPVLRIGELELGVEHRTLRKAGKEVHLSPKEFDMLALLMQHQNVPLTHARILRTIWGPEYGNEPDYLRSYVKTLRKKIEDDPAHPRYIVTEPWVGYRFRDPSDPDAATPSFDADDEEGG
jgi:two-component system, OmpR family, KDP operon response regulator KdpE